MAVVPICYKLPCKDQTLSILKGLGKKEGYFVSSTIDSEVTGCTSKNITRRGKGVLHKSSDCLISVNLRKWTCFSKKERGAEHSSTKKHLGSLESYLGKLKKNGDQSSSSCFNRSAELLRTSRQSEAEKGLASLNNYLDKVSNGENMFLDQSKAEESLLNYLDKVNKDANSKNYVTPPDTETNEAARQTLRHGFGNNKKKLENYVGFENKGRGPESSYDKASSLYLIGILASINIAVYLFQIATPVRNIELGTFSLPLLYGAKINHLILIGEWWRLVTPMFLHSGLLHVALGCWVLFSFGPQVCRAYGSFTFIMIYVLGGLSGNLTSFLHTSEPTVGGTGPVFAVIGAWLICQILNQEALGKAAATESMFQKAMLATALSCILSSIGPIDDWTHYGAALTGIAYGFLTCPILQIDDASSKSGEGFRLVNRYADSCRSLLFFSLFIIVLGSLIFLVEPPLN